MSRCLRYTMHKFMCDQVDAWVHAVYCFNHFRHWNDPSIAIGFLPLPEVLAGKHLMCSPIVCATRLNVDFQGHAARDNIWGACETPDVCDIVIQKPIYRYLSAPRYGSLADIDFLDPNKPNTSLDFFNQEHYESFSIFNYKSPLNPTSCVTDGKTFPIITFHDTNFFDGTFDSPFSYQLSYGKFKIPNLHKFFS